MFRTGFVSIIRSPVLYTQQQVNVIQDMLTACSYRLCWLHASKQSAYPVRHIPLLCVQYWTPDNGQKTCPKHVEFYSKNKFEKLVHLVGSIIRRLQPKEIAHFNGIKNITQIHTLMYGMTINLFKMYFYPSCAISDATRDTNRHKWDIPYQWQLN